jgi:protein SCO1/2
LVLLGIQLLGVLIAASILALADNSRWGSNYFPNVVLTTQNGVRVHFYDDLLKGKIVVIDMIYTHCVDSCPLETARLAQVQRMLGERMGKDVFFYSITLDPKRDTPEVLKAYAEKYRAGPGWFFLTGQKDDIELISRKLGLYSPPDPSNRDGHRAAVLLGNEATGEWIKNSATDNPRFLAIMIGDWLSSWRTGSVSPGISYAQARQLNISDKGQYFFSRYCAACHSIGHGDAIGPDLQGITRLRRHDWLARFIRAPDQMLAESDPVAVSLFEKYGQVQMPDLRLADEDVAAIINFLEKADAQLSRAGAADAALASEH